MEFPVLCRKFECLLPLKRSLNDCIPYLNELFAAEFEGVYRLDETTLFYEAASTCLISRSVTLSNQNLKDGMRLLVY
ncbi:MAG: hypothetical protein IKD66_06170 [Solobacterium sp.]|nr:hypothetical protein [Solobacterium sp.]